MITLAGTTSIAGGNTATTTYLIAVSRETASPDEWTPRFAAEVHTDSDYGTALVELDANATANVTITVTAGDRSTTRKYVVRVHRGDPRRTEARC